MPRYFEDVEVGDRYDLGAETVTEAALVEFAERWDPLPQHTDPEAATESITGSLIASGLHTMCLSNRLVTEAFRADLAGSIGLGFDDVRWPAPVHPGDEVRFHQEVVEKRPSGSKPGFGILRTRMTGEVEDKGVVLQYETTALLRRREAEPDGADGAD